MKSQWGGACVCVVRRVGAPKVVYPEGCCHQADTVLTTLGLYMTPLRIFTLLSGTESWTVQTADRSCLFLWARFWKVYAEHLACVAPFFSVESQCHWQGQHRRLADAALVS